MSNKFSKFNSIKITLASPNTIRKWSYGEITKSETINYRTFKPEKNGLFCASIFGPIKDYECLCGKYKKLKHRGIICEKCDVEVIKSKSRRERMGHIELASPVTHIWFLKSSPSRISLLLDMPLKDIERILYFDSYVVTCAGKTNLKKFQILTEEEYLEKLEKFGSDFKAGIGTKAIEDILKNINLSYEYKILKEQMQNTKSIIKKKKISKRSRFIETLIKSGNKPQWMILNVLPVIPPDLRPLVPLDGGKFATSDLNDLYRRVINRNNRLKRLLYLSAPEIIIKNEKRMLQEAVDTLLDNSRYHNVVTASNKRPLKSLTDMIKGKQGRFRQNLLGKRVDYSGRSVITVGPDLNLNQCGIPKKMALELFKPFIYGKLELRGLSNTIKSSKKMVDQEDEAIWDILDELIKEHPILLNRAPTLHRLGIQAFEPILVDGKAIQLHPLVCTAYNADFDGDQMAIHIPLTLEAQIESRALMMSTNNILSPANGESIIIPSQDIVLGLYYMTKEKKYGKGEGMVLNDSKDALRLYDLGVLELHTKIKIKISEYKSIVKKKKIILKKIISFKNTTVGRSILWSIFPKELSFSLINKIVDIKEIVNIFNICNRVIGIKRTAIFADKIMKIGFHYASRSGISIGMDDIIVPKEKNIIINKSRIKVKEIQQQFNSGFVTSSERYNKIIDIWTETSEKISKFMMDNISKEMLPNNNGKLELQSSFNNIFMMADSGARGSTAQIRQLAGIRGLMAKPDGSIIENPITANFSEGLNIIQYFISTHGARKGLSDTALKTANSGYLTRRLVDVTQDLVIVEYDCKTKNGIIIKSVIEGQYVSESLSNRILGRVTVGNVTTPETNKILIKNNILLDENLCKIIEKNNINFVKVRSVITCNTNFGICARCYGIDLSRGKLVNQGEAVGIIAAQSIGEPGTQLTMRTFHIGGTASRSTSISNIKVNNDGKIRLKNAKILINHFGKYIVVSKNVKLQILDKFNRILENYKLPYGACITKKNNDYVRSGEIISNWDPHTVPVISDVNGYIKFVDIIDKKSVIKKTDNFTGLTSIIILDVSERSSKNKYLQPRFKILDKKGNEILIPKTKLSIQYILPDKTIINIEDNIKINSGDILAKIPKDSIVSKDITGGLPKVADIFEARNPKNKAILSKLNGVVSFGKSSKTKRKIIIKSKKNNDICEENISRLRQLNVVEGEIVQIGDIISDGPISSHDILKLHGLQYLNDYIVNSVQEVYRLQGVKINDKHIEIVIRQMLRKVIIIKAGDSEFFDGEQIEFSTLKIINKSLKSKGKKLITFKRSLLGITKASLSTDSFISAASFQETTKVLTESSLSGRRDELRGLKENVIVGRIIPSGTGYSYHQKILKKRLKKYNKKKKKN
ncbi:DNA-directed RNA polymerase subunit beta', partial [Candidatus Annandia adelgestsuga]|uniref:DNA-directed RNA polymerase subunit beta' n=1 Tax=Candidatus Annandia adelgestsuga TaxID=1302411 RepID=UPI000F7FA7AE